MLLGGLALLLAACQPAPESPTRTLLVRGSTTEALLVQRLGELWSERRPEIAVAVAGGGSSVGVAALIAGRVDLAAVSRAPTPLERLMAQRAGIELSESLVGCDVVALIVNADNPVRALRLDEAEALLSGEVQDWSGWGLEAPVRIFGRPASSGTQAVVREVLLAGDFSAGASALSGHAQVIEGVAETPGGLGYVSMTALQQGASGVRALALVDADGVRWSPEDPEHVASLGYPLVRRLLQLSAGPPEGALQDFLAFERSEEGQQIATSLGFAPIPEDWRGDVQPLL
ncbi:MAG: phosphate ABC transporter substrate-binding protein [Alphaproteobacteria bacterium]|nr:phosphate ABC transporter substrate-binding protein [Alphaproteobacteria bacterium]